VFSNACPEAGHQTSTSHSADFRTVPKLPWPVMVPPSRGVLILQGGCQRKGSKPLFLWLLQPKGNMPCPYREVRMGALKSHIHNGPFKRSTLAQQIRLRFFFCRSFCAGEYLFPASAQNVLDRSATSEGQVTSPPNESPSRPKPDMPFTPSIGTFVPSFIHRLPKGDQ